MILASFIGIFAIPPLYVMFQAIREKLRKGARPVEETLRPETPRQAPACIVGVPTVEQQRPAAE